MKIFNCDIVVERTHAVSVNVVFRTIFKAVTIDALGGVTEHL